MTTIEPIESRLTIGPLLIERGRDCSINISCKDEKSTLSLEESKSLSDFVLDGYYQNMAIEYDPLMEPSWENKFAERLQNYSMLNAEDWVKVIRLKGTINNEIAEEAASWLIHSKSASEIVDELGMEIYAGACGVIGHEGEGGIVGEACAKAKERLAGAELNASLCGVVSTRKDLEKKYDASIEEKDRAICELRSQIERKKGDFKKELRKIEGSLAIKREEARWIGITSGVYIGVVGAFTAFASWSRFGDTLYSEMLRQELFNLTWQLGVLFLPLILLGVYLFATGRADKKYATQAAIGE